LKIKLEINSKRYTDICKELEACGITVSEDADLVLRENIPLSNHIIVKDMDDGEMVRLSVSDIIYIESFGHDVRVYTQDCIYRTTERLYKIQSQLAPQQFTRVSNSVIVSINCIRRIRPVPTQKFVLTLKTGQTIDVTRSYFHAFKKALGL